MDRYTHTLAEEQADALRVLPNVSGDHPETGQAGKQTTKAG